MKTIILNATAVMLTLFLCKTVLQEGSQLSVTYRNSKKPSVREPYIGFRGVKLN